MRFAAPFVLFMLAAAAVQAQQIESPCPVRDSAITAGAPGTAPKIAVLEGSDLAGWQAPVCAGWAPETRAKLVVTLSGTFRFDGGMDGLLTRVGEISRMPAIAYWSARDKKLEPLAKDAAALASPNAQDRREDFSPDELKAGAELYYWQDDALTGGTVYGLKVYENTPDSVVIGTDNVTAVHKSIFSLFRPGASRSALFLKRISPGLYRATIVASALQGSSSLVTGHEEVYVNRARALFNFLAGKAQDEPRLALSAQ